MSPQPPSGVIRRGQWTSSDQGTPWASEEQTLGESYVLSPAFVNAHSHLEYRGMQGPPPAGGLAAFLRYVGEAKKLETPSDVEASCLLAAKENRKTGVYHIWEHSDRPGSRKAFAETGIGGLIFQEVITLFGDPSEVLEAVRMRARAEGAIPNPHAVYTVHAEVLSELARQSGPLTIHAAESEQERALLSKGAGAIAERRRQLGIPLPHPSRSPIQALHDSGFLGPLRQVVHACDLDEEDMDLIQRAGSVVAHCPRSNSALDCPPTPVQKLRRRGVKVGLGMDSPASGGPINMFAEMREALVVSRRAGDPLEPEEAWLLACEEGAASVQAGPAPWIGIWTRGRSVGEVLEAAQPEDVFWL